MYWRGASVAGSSAEANGGSFNSFPEDDATFVHEILRPTPVISYFNSNNYTGLLGSTYGENNSIPNGNYFYEFEINSDTTINKITITYDAGVVASSDLYTGIYKFNCSSTTSTGTGSSGTTQVTSASCDFKTVERIIGWTTDDVSLNESYPFEADYNSNTSGSDWVWDAGSGGYGFAVGAGNAGPGSTSWPSTTAESVLFEKTGVNSKELKIEFEVITGSINYTVKCYNNQGEIIEVYAKQRHNINHSLIGNTSSVKTLRYSDYINETEISSKPNNNTYDRIYGAAGTDGKAYSDLNIFSNQLIDKIEIEFESYDPNPGEGRVDFKVWKFDCADGSSGGSGSGGSGIDNTSLLTLSLH